MADLPHPWDMYTRLQNNLRRDHRVSDRSWGTEAGMDCILNAPAGPPTTAEVNQGIAASRRRERYRGCRRAPMPEDLATPHPEGALHARHVLAAIQRRLSDRNWLLMTAVATGSDYSEVARTMSMSQGAFRVRVLRLRRELIALAA